MDALFRTAARTGCQCKLGEHCVFEREQIDAEVEPPVRPAAGEERT